MRGRLHDDEQAFRNAVASGLSPAEAAQRLNVPAKMVGYFTKRLPKQKQAVPPSPQPSPAPVQPLTPPAAVTAFKNFDDEDTP